MKYFQLSEFACPCCGHNEMDAAFLEKLDKLREIFDSPLHVNSGFRCPKHNKEIGGVPDSMHLLGRAADISTADMTAEKVWHFVLSAHSSFNGMGIGKNFIHVDNRDKQALWVY